MTQIDTCSHFNSKVDRLRTQEMRKEATKTMKRTIMRLRRTMRHWKKIQRVPVVLMSIMMRAHLQKRKSIAALTNFRVALVHRQAQKRQAVIMTLAKRSPPVMARKNRYMRRAIPMSQVA